MGDPLGRTGTIPGIARPAIGAVLPGRYGPVVLCDVADQSYEQIAMTLEIPVGTVRSRIHRGRRLLRAALAGAGAGEGA